MNAIENNKEQTFTSPDVDKFTTPILEVAAKESRETLTDDTFSKSLDKFSDQQAKQKKERDEPKETLSEKTETSSNKSEGKFSDPISLNNEKDYKSKSEDKSQVKESKPFSSKKIEDLLKEDKEPSKEKSTKNSEKKEDSAISDDEIEAELKTPKSEKSQKRFQELHRRWKAAEAKALSKESEITKQLKEKEAKLASLEKEMQSIASKQKEVDPEIQKQLDELLMYRRQFEVESSDHIKNTFDRRLARADEDIYTVLKASGIRFKNMDESQSIEQIKSRGGFRQFVRDNPELGDQIIDSLNVADRKEVEAAMMGQTLLAKERQMYIEAEKLKAKEYFSEKQKEADSIKASQIAPEEIKERQSKAINDLKEKMFSSMDMFKDSSVPEQASEEERSKILEQNKFAAELRDTLSANLSATTDDDFIDVAIAATIAHKLKRENTMMRQQIKSLTEQNERIKSAGKTTSKGGILPLASESSQEKPAPTFEASLNRILGRQ
jgi:hypothetical protein